MVNSFSKIEDKLKQFTKKYYLNKILKGLIFWFLSILLFSLLTLCFEYFLYLSVRLKTSILILFLVFSFFSFFYLIIFPLINYLGYFKPISRRQINKIVVNQFPDIKDKLLNVIELHDEFDNSIYSKELIISSIDQKISEISKYKLIDAINLKENISLLYYFLGAIFITVIISVFTPDFLKGTTYRMINFKQAYEKPSPYKFILLNSNLSVGKGEDFVVNIKISGKNVENILFISVGGKSFLMKNDSTNYFSYKFNNINNDIYFQFIYTKYKSQFYKLDILEKPILNNFSVKLVKPQYTQLKNEELDNVTEFLIPEGTNVSFKFNSVHTDSLLISVNNSNSIDVERSNSNIFNFSKVFYENTQLGVSLKNEYFYLVNYLKLNIKTIPDEYPVISVKKFSDSIDFTKIYFKGSIGDDYGFSNLKFIIKFNDLIDTAIVLNFERNFQNQEFYYAFNFNFYKNKYKTINYFFEISDNDQVKGPKKAISEVFSFVFPDDQEILENQTKDFQQIQDIISNSMNLTDQLKKDLIEVERKLINSELTEWERKEIQNNILSKKQNIDKEIEKLKIKSDEINNYLKSFTDQDQKIIEKQKQIQNLLDDVFSEDMKKLLDEFNKMMQDYNKDKISETKEKLDISLDDLSKQLDKNLEMLRQMQIEQQLDIFSKSLEKIIEEQEQVIKEAETDFKKDELSIKEKKLKDKIYDSDNLYKEIDELNKQLKEPLNLFDLKQEFDEIQKEFSNSLDNIEKENKKKTKESLNKNSKNLKNLDFKIKQLLDSLFSEQKTENLEDLLQILDNLIIFSFNQEKLINSTNRNNFNSVTFSLQKKLFTDYEIIKDSLYSLAQREPSLDSKINKELVLTQYHFKDIETNFEENAISKVLVNQQNVLTSVNELSLFISEIIKQLQKDMANSMPGNQNCKKPGNNPNPSSMSSSLKSMQKSLQQQLEKALQMMKNGSSGKEVNNELGKSISQQEAMHDLLQKMMNQGQVGSSAYETLKQADQLLNNVKEDILRNNVSNSTIDRQKQILTRLLEADKAENERDIDEKRKSNTASKQFFNETDKQFENNQTINNFDEKLLKNKLILNSYYQVKYQKYINVLDSINGEIFNNNFISK